MKIFQKRLPEKTGWQAKFVFFVLLLVASVSVSGQSPEELVEISLSSDLNTWKPGDSGWLLVEVKVLPKWHMYWKNAGESGYPTSIEWSGDEVDFGSLQFPKPKKYEFLEMVIYVHEASFVLLTEISLDKDYDIGEKVSIKGNLSTLICSEENCIPFDTEIAIEIPVAKESSRNQEKLDILKSAKEKWPNAYPVETKLSASIQQGSISFRVENPVLNDFEVDGFYFFPDTEYIGHSLSQRFTYDAKTSALEWSLPINDDLPPASTLAGVLIHEKLGSGWILEWELDSMRYGDLKSEIKTESPRFQIMGDSMGMNSLWLFLGMVVITFAVWIYGKSSSPGLSGNVVKGYRVIAGIFLILGIWCGFPWEEKPVDGEIEWGEWSPELEASLKKQGKAIYVDYTAKWCASCLVNKRVYSNDSIITLFKDKEVVALRADWTDRGPVILESLQSFGRSGVPLNVFHSASKVNSPVVLPEILTKKNVRLAIEEYKSYQPDSHELGFGAILGFAALGGLILNLMPCVFPVIGLKVMSFVKQAGEDPGQIKKHGLLFTAGVILSFWLLVSILLTLRDSLAEDLGWGFQLQEPIFVFVLAIFLLIFALSLSGVFEIGMSLTGFGAKLTHTEGMAASFFSGVLATVVATPCMAPFLGVAVGAALTMEWLPAFTIFTFVALGLSAPYLILSICPQWLSRLPKPGAWMETFKQALAFPLYGTVVWLLWTLQSLL